jgi:hypothetical protein
MATATTLAGLIRSPVGVDRPSVTTSLHAPAAGAGQATGPRRPPASRLRAAALEAAFPLAVAAAVCAVVAYVNLSTPTGVDYNIRYPVSADNAAPAIAALAHGHLGAFLAHQPLMGLLSLLLRAPVAWLTGSLGGGAMLVYRLGALVCLLPTAFLAGWLAVSSRAAGATAAGVAAAAIILLGTPTIAAIAWGHPEEVLTATLAAAALLAAYRGHAIWAGLAVGAAIGTKDWAVIALAPALIALPTGRGRAAIAAGGLALALAAPAPLLDPAAFARAGHALGGGHLVTALSAWRPLSSTSPVAGASLATLPLHLTKSLALPLGLALALAVSLALTWVVGRPGARLRARGRVPDAFALLCLLAVVRCVADPGPVEYYFVAAVIPLAAWEAAALRRLPVAALLTVAAVWFTFGPGGGFAATPRNAVTLGWAGALICYLAVRAFYIGRPAPDALPGRLMSRAFRPIRDA